MRHILSLLVRCEGNFLFASGGLTGEVPFSQILDTQDSLPPTIASDALLHLIAGLAKDIGILAKEVRQIEILTSETLRPYEDIYIHIAVYDVALDVLRRLQGQHPESVLVAATTISQNVNTNLFFRSIAENQWVESSRDQGAA